MNREPFTIVHRTSVEKDLRRIPARVVARVLDLIEGLAREPFPRGSVKLSGAEGLYRARVGDYRVVYGVDTEARVLTIHYVRHRREVYRGM